MGEPVRDERLQRRTRRIRRVGYVFFLGCVVALVGILARGAVEGLRHDAARDPFTDVPVHELRAACAEWGESLPAGEGARERLAQRAWSRQCE